MLANLKYLLILLSVSVAIDILPEASSDVQPVVSEAASKLIEKYSAAPAVITNDICRDSDIAVITPKNFFNLFFIFIIINSFLVNRYRTA